MQKIIFYMSLFSAEIESGLEKLRSKSGNSNSQDFIAIDLDDISQDFLNLILNTLEKYGLYRLSLLICNRYQLREKTI